jgi:hypothetical protein
MIRPDAPAPVVGIDTSRVRVRAACLPVDQRSPTDRAALGRKQPAFQAVAPKVKVRVKAVLAVLSGQIAPIDNGVDGFIRHCPMETGTRANIVRGRALHAEAAAEAVPVRWVTGRGQR